MHFFDQKQNLAIFIRYGELVRLKSLSPIHQFRSTEMSALMKFGVFFEGLRDADIPLSWVQAEKNH